MAYFLTSNINQMNDLILLFSSKYFVKQESHNKFSLISYEKLDQNWANAYNLKLHETHILMNSSYQYVFELN